MSDRRNIATNRRARHEYFIEDTYEAGLVLKGTEVKSIRASKLSIQEAFATIEKGEVFINNMHISPYEQGNIQNVDPLRKRKLLLNRREIRRLEAGVGQKGYTIVPLNVYLKKGLVKMEIGLGKGKKLYDKREDIQKRDVKRRLERYSHERNR